MMRSGFAAIPTLLYLAVFGCAAAYPLFDHRTFAGLPAVMLGLPWIDYLPSRWLLVAIGLNAVIMYAVLAALSFLVSRLSRIRRG